MTEYGKWQWRFDKRVGWNRPARLVRSMGPFGVVREQWEWIAPPRKDAPTIGYGDDAASTAFLAALNGEPIPDRYAEGYEAGKKAQSPCTQPSPVWAHRPCAGLVMTVAQRVPKPESDYNVGYATGKLAALNSFATEALEAELRRRIGNDLGVTLTDQGRKDIREDGEYLKYIGSFPDRRKADRRKMEPPSPCDGCSYPGQCPCFDKPKKRSAKKTKRNYYIPQVFRQPKGKKRG